MRVHAPAVEDVPGGRRVRADVTWEGPHRGPPSLWFETDDASADDLAPAPDGFALAALPFAAALGEPRLAVDGTLCPRLLDGMRDAMRVLAHWYPACRVVPVEASAGPEARLPRAPRRAAQLLSGGVDSLAMLRRNRATFPPDHPLAVRDAYYLVGWHSDDLAPDGSLRPGRLRMHAEQRARLERLGASAGFGVVTVRGNVRAFCPDYAFLRDVALSASMLAVAHLFARRTSDVWYASEGHGPGAAPHGSHVLLDGLHASSAVEVHVGDPFTRRMEKLASIVDWPEAMAALQACLLHDELPAGAANCGACEKCRRTMLGLVALGALDRATTFPRGEPAEAIAAGYRPSTPGQVDYYATEVAAALDAAGRGDLAATVRAQMARARRRERRKRWRRGLAAVLGRPRRPRGPA